jgi:hypothetical protein
MKTHLIKLSACKIASLIAICVCFWLHTIFAQERNIQKASGSQGQTNSNLSQASKNGFSAMMFFTEDLDFPKNFAQGGDITLDATTSVRVDTPFLLTVSFSGPGVTSEGNADVALDITITKPDGTTYFEAKDAPAWKGRYPYSETSTQLAEAVVKLTIKSKDPVGRYTAKGTIRDKVKGIDLPIEKTFDVTE